MSRVPIERKVAVDAQGVAHDCGQATNDYTHALLAWFDASGRWAVYSRHRSAEAAETRAQDAAGCRAYSLRYAVVELEVRTDV